MAATLIAVGGGERNLGRSPAISGLPAALPPSTIDQAPIDGAATSIFDAAVERFRSHTAKKIARVRHCGRPNGGPA
ncbi:MAG: hypothetical protein ACRECP_11300 [Methylocella sp.]